jgi:hypothetical protein
VLENHDPHAVQDSIIPERCGRWTEMDRMTDIAKIELLGRHPRRRPEAASVAPILPVCRLHLGIETPPVELRAHVERLPG